MTGKNLARGHEGSRRNGGRIHRFTPPAARRQDYGELPVK